jgi:peptide/nickel transport system permease protein
MGAFLLRRLLFLGLTLLLVATFTFLLTFVIPSNTAEILAGPRTGVRDLEEIRTELGLDDPILVQYGRYLANVLSLDLGYSYTHRSNVASVIAERLPWTLYLAIAAMVLSMGIGIPIGLLSAAKQDGWFDRTTLGGALLVISIPQFFLGLLLLYVFAYRIPLFPLGRAESPSAVCLPAIALGLPGAAWYSRIMRASAVDTLHSEFVRSLRAKGTPKRALLFKHAFRAAFSPVLTMTAIDFGFLLGGAVIVESVFSWPGIGLTTYQAVRAGDTALVMGCVLVGAFFVLAMNLASDLARAALDPRVRLA